MLFDWKWKTAYIRANTQYLKKGKYFFLQNMRTVVEKKSKKTLKQLFPNDTHSLKSKIKLFVANLKSINVCNDGDSFRATAIYFSNAGKDENRVIKFFDYDDKRVLTVCQNSSQYEQYFHNREMYSRFYQVPLLIEKDFIKTRYIEEYIDKKTIEKSHEEVIYQKLADLFSTVFEENDCIVKDCDYDLPLALQAEVSYVPTKLKTFEQHGDLSRANFIYAQDRIIFIDFEHQGQYPVFYDLLFLITNRYIGAGDCIGLELFEQGFFDDYFARILPDSKTPVTDILTSFIIVFHEKRIGHLQGWPIYDRYMDLFKRMLRNKNGK